MNLTNSVRALFVGFFMGDAVAIGGGCRVHKEREKVDWGGGHHHKGNGENSGKKPQD